MSYAVLQELLPKGALLARLTALCRFYMRQPLDLSLHISVPASQIARTQLGRKSTGGLGSPSSAGAPQQDPVIFAMDVSLSRSAASPRMSVVKTREV